MMGYVRFSSRRQHETATTRSLVLETGGQRSREHPFSSATTSPPVEHDGLKYVKRRVRRNRRSQFFSPGVACRNVQCASRPCGSRLCDCSPCISCQVTSVRGKVFKGLPISPAADWSVPSATLSDVTFTELPKEQWRGISSVMSPPKALLGQFGELDADGFLLATEARAAEMLRGGGGCHPQYPRAVTRESEQHAVGERRHQSARQPDDGHWMSWRPPSST